MFLVNPTWNSARSWDSISNQFPRVTLLQLFIRAILLIAVMACAACVTLEQAAPPIELLAGAAGAGEHAKLVLGRDLYITRCAKCHTVEPVTKYSLEHWQNVMPEMAGKSHLTATETDAVMAYVLKVLAAGQGRG